MLPVLLSSLMLLTICVSNIWESFSKLFQQITCSLVLDTKAATVICQYKVLVYQVWYPITGRGGIHSIQWWAPIRYPRLVGSSFFVKFILAFTMASPLTMYHLMKPNHLHSHSYAFKFNLKLYHGTLNMLIIHVTISMHYFLEQEFISSYCSCIR